MKVSAEMIARITMVVLGVFWIVLGVLAVQDASLHPFIIVLMFVDAFIFLVLAFCYAKRRFFKIVTVIFLLGNIILSVTDEVGVLDIAVLILGIIALAGVLLSLRAKNNGTPQ